MSPAGAPCSAMSVIKIKHRACMPCTWYWQCPCPSHRVATRTPRIPTRQTRGRYAGSSLIVQVVLFVHPQGADAAQINPVAPAPMDHTHQDSGAGAAAQDGPWRTHVGHESTDGVCRAAGVAGHHGQRHLAPEHHLQHPRRGVAVERRLFVLVAPVGTARHLIVAHGYPPVAPKRSVLMRPAA